MLTNLRCSWIGLAVAVATLSVLGCASSTTDKTGPQVSSSAASSLSPKAPSKSKTSTSMSQGPASGSSLDAHRQGKTPESGPLREVFFAFDRYELSEQARATLRENAAWLKTNPSARVEIEGHCDERGTTEYNLALGAKRAAAARDYLLSLGVAAGRISSTSFGEELPACREVSDDCYQKNRRDRFVALSPRPAN
jgi:peptidoglycan-associated lipoprotein